MASQNGMVILSSCDNVSDDIKFHIAHNVSLFLNLLFWVWIMALDSSIREKH